MQTTIATHQSEREMLGNDEFKSMIKSKSSYRILTYAKKLQE